MTPLVSKKNTSEKSLTLQLHDFLITVILPSKFKVQPAVVANSKFSNARRKQNSAWQTENQRRFPRKAFLLKEPKKNYISDQKQCFCLSETENRILQQTISRTTILQKLFDEGNDVSLHERIKQNHVEKWNGTYLVLHTCAIFRTLEWWLNGRDPVSSLVSFLKRKQEQLSEFSVQVKTYNVKCIKRDFSGTFQVSSFGVWLANGCLHRRNCLWEKNRRSERIHSQMWAKTQW